jgi:transposase
MSDKELRAAQEIGRVLRKEMTTKEAAEALSVSERTVRRMKAKVRRGGASALAHRARGKKGNRRMRKGERVRMESLLRERYTDFTPTFAAEKLAELHGIVHDVKTVRASMIALGLWKIGAKTRAVHRTWRERRAKRGSLSQYDGSYHAWLEERYAAPDGSHELCLLLAIDDATGDLEGAEFAPHEGVLPTLGFWREYALRRGLPSELYVDRFSTYKMHMKTASENPDTLTQFERVLRRLGTRIIFALSPQAKGRVERVFRTLQDRLVKELRLRGISTPEEANIFLKETFIPDFNRRFGVPAREEGDLHRPLTAKERGSVDAIFCREDERTVQNDFTVSYGGTWHQLLETPRLAIRPKDKVIVRTTPEGAVSLSVRGRLVRSVVIAKERRVRPAPGQIHEKRTFLIPAQADISNSR